MMIGNLLKRRSFNDTLALLIAFGVLFLWVAVALSLIVWESAIQRYFRKEPPWGREVE